MAFILLIDGLDAVDVVVIISGAVYQLKKRCNSSTIATTTF